MPGRILVVDDIPTNRFLTRTKLGLAYYDVIEAGSGEEAIARARADQPDMVLLDVVMPGIDGFETCRRLKADAQTAHIPVVMLTALDDRASRIEGLESGCDDFLSRPFADAALLARVRSLTRMKMLTDELRESLAGGAVALLDPAMQPDYTRSRILIAISDADLGAALARTLRERLGAEAHVLTGEQGARAALEAGGADAVLIGPALADGEPMRLAAHIRGRPRMRTAALVMIFEAEDGLHQQLAMDMGVSDYLTMPPDPAELAARLRVQLRRKHYADRLRRSLEDGMEMAVTDPLTGLHNRRYCDARLVDMMAHAEAVGRPLMLMMIDLDDFKLVNDRFGHAAGDRMLAEVAERLRASLRDRDLLARIGGEEFLAAMPEMPAAAAASVAERVRAAVAAPPFTVSGQDEVTLTVSIGISAHRAGESAAAFFDRADQALYASKSGGRNRVTAAEG